uniref:Uncharacterized protein n=1 Tax=Rhizophagus irregularis (strain DAOM 181602 / DAOM 197198 / MUCL 43194) TaxID=747089 RepID=U9TM31_RHIID
MTDDNDRKSYFLNGFKAPANTLKTKWTPKNKRSAPLFKTKRTPRTPPGDEMDFRERSLESK